MLRRQPTTGSCPWRLLVCWCGGAWGGGLLTPLYRRGKGEVGRSWGGVERDREEGGRGSSLLSTGGVEGRVEKSWGRGEKERGGGEREGGLEKEGGDTHVPLSAVIGVSCHWSRALLV